MQHYRVENWIDFSRGVAPDTLRSAMQEHLNGGCDECSKEFAVWGSVSEFANSESLFTPPAGVVRKIKLAVPADAPAPVTSRIREMAELIFDSFQAPQLAGVRATHMSPRQLLYKAGPILIDMRMESLGDTGKCSLVGQVMRSEKEGEGMSDLGVHLLRGQNELANTHTNSFGEFSLEYETAWDLQVSLEVSPVKDVYIPLEGTLWRSPSKD
jgi:hypothetical protein